MNADGYNHCSVCIEADRLAPVAARANTLIRASTGKPIQLCPRPTIDRNRDRSVARQLTAHARAAASSGWARSSLRWNDSTEPLLGRLQVGRRALTAWGFR